MKIQMPFAPKAKLMDILVRRKQSLTEWANEVGIKSVLQLELYCTKNKLALPSTDDLITAFAPVAPKFELFDVKAKEEVSKDVELKEAELEEPKKVKKLRNALVKQSEIEFKKEDSSEDVSTPEK